MYVWRRKNVIWTKIRGTQKSFLFPDDSCTHEALAASAWNLPMIAFVSLPSGLIKTFYDSKLAEIVLCSVTLSEEDFLG